MGNWNYTIQRGEGTAASPSAHSQKPSMAKQFKVQTPTPATLAPAPAPKAGGTDPQQIGPGETMSAPSSKPPGMNL